MRDATCKQDENRKKDRELRNSGLMGRIATYSRGSLRTSVLTMPTRRALVRLVTSVCRVRSPIDFPTYLHLLIHRGYSGALRGIQVSTGAFGESEVASVLGG